MGANMTRRGPRSRSRMRKDAEKEEAEKDEIVA